MLGLSRRLFSGLANLWKYGSDSLVHPVPALLSIIIYQFIDIEILVSNLVKQDKSMLFLWLCLTTFSDFLFGILSDRRLRKATLIFSQLLGIIAGVVLWKSEIRLWTLFVVAVTFNPISVARAAFLDFCAGYPTVPMVALTWLVEALPLAFFTYIAKVDYFIMIVILLSALVFDLILTLLPVNIKKINLHKNSILNNESTKHPKKISLFFKRSILFILIPYFMGESNFQITGILLEYTPNSSTWWNVISGAAVLGILSTMFFKSIPNLAFITITYIAGAAFCLLGFYIKLNQDLEWILIFFIVMTFCSVMGGLYIPFVTDALIQLLGSTNRALASALVEAARTLAEIVVTLISVTTIYSAKTALISITILWILAAYIMKTTEQNVKLKTHTWT